MQGTVLDDDALIAAVWEALGRIVDPCMAASGRDLSLRDMGLINRVDKLGAILEVGITFTDPLCKFSPRIVAAIEAIRDHLPGVAAVRVVPEFAPMWRETRLGVKARALLEKG